MLLIDLIYNYSIIYFCYIILIIRSWVKHKKIILAIIILFLLSYLPVPNIFYSLKRILNFLDEYFPKEYIKLFPKFNCIINKYIWLYIKHSYNSIIDSALLVTKFRISHYTHCWFCEQYGCTGIINCAPTFREFVPRFRRPCTSGDKSRE